MPSPLIIITRHAEKPEPPTQGVDSAGNQDPHSLVVQGWQRSGAMIHAFKPASGAPAAPLATPACIIAASPHPGVGTDDPSLREQETVSAVAAALSITVNDSLAAGQESDAAALALAQPGTVLLCWDHKLIHTDKAPSLVSFFRVVDATHSPASGPRNASTCSWSSPWTPPPRNTLLSRCHKCSCRAIRHVCSRASQQTFSSD